MKKTLVRIVALMLLAVMILSVIPAFAANIVGDIASQTNLYQKKSASSDVIAQVQGTVTVIGKDADNATMYQITFTSGGKTYTGWVPASTVANLRYDSGSGSSASVGSTGTTGSSYSSTGTYSANINAETTVYGDNNKSVGSVRGTVTVNYRNADSTQVHITASGTGGTLSGWVTASALSGLYSRNSGSVQVKDLPTNGTGSSAAAAATYTKYTTAVTAVSNDSTIYMRPKAERSTSGATKIKSAKGLSFTILGESGDYYYASYGTSTGFVRKRDFSITSGATPTPNATPAPGMTAPTTTYPKAKTGISTDRTIYMRVKPDKSTEGAKKITGARGASFTLLGESGDYYYASYNGSTGYVRKQDFTVNDDTPIQGATAKSTSTSGATTPGSGASSEKWGSFSVPGGSTYSIYGNYYRTVGGNNYYYYATKSSGKETYDYLHTTTAAGSQIQVVMGHNMRESKSMFHKLHHVQNAILGVSTCEGCGGSCGSSYNTKTISASLDGYRTWDIALFYEIPKGSSTSILPFNSQPWNTSTSQYLSTQSSYAKQSGLKGWVNPNVSLDSNGKYMMLVTCGDKYESNSNATSKLYMLLKARG